PPPRKNPMPLPEILAQRLSSATGHPFTLAGVTEGAGGCINRTMVLKSHDGRRFFAKLNEGTRLAMFEAEAEGLQELGKAEALRVPRSEEHTSELQSQSNLVCRLLLEKKKTNK